ncbi:MAG TPA: M48 family metallopeptidase [Acidiferrobacterales bacterium]|nr:M48 family metallopeptidase [Acidiferrobacterales bacterium]
MNSFTFLFVSLLALMLLVRVWLAQRHILHVVKHRAAVPEAFKEKIPLSAHTKAADYTVAKTSFGILETGVSGLLLVLWTLGGGLDFLDHLWRSLHLGPLATGTAFILSVFLIMGLLDLPFELYQTFVIEQRFGFNKTGAKTFITDLMKKLLLSALIGVPLLLAVLWLMQEMGARWWLYVWMLWTAFSLSLLWAYPALIAPLFNKFRPLAKETLVTRIQSLLERTGFKSRGVFVMDGSRRSAHGNAYFTGLGRNKRIVFFDTLLDSLNESEIEAVLAHELGHFKRRHVIKRMLLMFGMSFLGLALLGWLMQQAWFYTGLGVSQPSTYAALVLFLMVVPVFTFFLHPLMAWGSRRHEFEADAFAAEQSDAHALANALVKLYEENANTLTPDPLHSAFYDSHPPAARRIAQLQALAG